MAGPFGDSVVAAFPIRPIFKTLLVQNTVECSFCFALTINYGFSYLNEFFSLCWRLVSFFF